MKRRQTALVSRMHAHETEGSIFVVYEDRVLCLQLSFDSNTIKPSVILWQTPAA